LTIFYCLWITQPQRGDILIVINQQNKVKAPLGATYEKVVYFIPGSQYKTLCRP
jgi:hypothetical protein